MSVVGCFGGSMGILISCVSSLAHIGTEKQFHNLRARVDGKKTTSSKIEYCNSIL